jgi:hypothetical protein
MRPTLRTPVLTALALAALATTAAAGPGAVAATAAVPARVMPSTALLQLEDVRGAGLAVDSAELDATGDALLGDAGRFDEGCLGEKTMRNITSSKAYPIPGEARAYYDVTWSSTLDKDVWLREAVAEGTSARRTDRYVATLRSEIASVRSCEEDPVQGHHYGRAHTVRSGPGTATFYRDLTSDGDWAGGGVAIVRDGTRFGFVDLMAGGGSSGALRRVAVAAVDALR